jgi:capsular exopolysaccharide synthesis family protein
MALKDSRVGDASVRTVLISSALPRDGKSTVTLNLATSLADGSKTRVLVLEADLRRPSLEQYLGMAPASGLADILHGQLGPFAAIRRIEPLGFYLLPAGRMPDSATELLQRDKLGALIATLALQFDWVLIDSPPAAPLADTMVLKEHADAILLVVRAGSTPREAVEETTRLLAPKSVIGVVLNEAEGLDRLYSEYYR